MIHDRDAAACEWCDSNGLIAGDPCAHSNGETRAERARRLSARARAAIRPTKAPGWATTNGARK